MKNTLITRFSDDSIATSINELPAKYEGDEPSFYRESEAKLMDSVIVNNDKVRYYYNKTLCLREPIGNMLDVLEVLHRSTFAYLSQLPETGDYSVISTLFELIPTISVLIDWNNLNHSCYWEDFCRETKQLILLLDKVNGAALRCSDTATELLQRAQELFHGVLENNRRHLRIDRAISFRKETDYIYENTSSQNIQIKWQKPGDEIELKWYDADGGLLNVSLKQAGTGFRLRLLRHLIYYARCLLERAYLELMKLNVALHLHIPIEKLVKCRDVQLKQLTHQEHACLAKAKREFDSSLDLLWQIVSRFKFQAFHLLKYSATFKGMRKASGIFPRTAPTFSLLKMSIEDSLLLRVISSGIQAQANDESFDFTVFPDRTEDITAKVEDLLAVDSSGYKELFVLLNIVRIMLPSERSNFTAKEKACLYDEIAMILAHRFQVRRSLKQALHVFEKHPAFNKMECLKLLTPVKHASRKVHGFETYLSESSGGSETELQGMASSLIPRDGNNNENSELQKTWVTVEGGIKITTDGGRGVLTKSPLNNNAIKSYNELQKDEKVILCMRAVRQLLVCIANEQCAAKISRERILETKSLVKRLKIKDRQNQDLQRAILEQNKLLRLKLQLTKAMRFLK